MAGMNAPLPAIEVLPRDLSAYRAGNTGIDYVHRFESGRPGPHVMINGLTHGNEFCGMVAVCHLLDSGVRPRIGTLTLNQRLAAGSFDEASAVDIELEPGEMSLHDVYMIHGANANRSTRRRTGVALRYMPTTSVFERDLRPAEGKTGIAVDFAHRPLWLVRGRDRSGRNDLEVGHRR